MRLLGQIYIYSLFSNCRLSCLFSASQKTEKYRIFTTNILNKKPCSLVKSDLTVFITICRTSLMCLLIFNGKREGHFCQTVLPQGLVAQSEV